MHYFMTLQTIIVNFIPELLQCFVPEHFPARVATHSCFIPSCFSYIAIFCFAFLSQFYPHFRLREVEFIHNPNPMREQKVIMEDNNSVFFLSFLFYPKLDHQSRSGTSNVRTSLYCEVEVPCHLAVNGLANFSLFTFTSRLRE